ncbi:AraC family transcriptional regulator [Paenibacillus sp. P96]|uniref:AraC family transcriptional regulator n=1 Tax=Paenibacillus zeirhizosphaerae TaxID=2987519 RepID=A0ABT9FS83_9BACL|nr:helix-turn-helix transcriptional regulator [Paenibacillus sp. P96]MDP4097594.1 AraC family transcriptional regulator [Paenibacillus sp. P96]
METVHKRYFLTHREQPLPMYMESIGWNGRQEQVDRPEGYPLYHWLQTVQGEGRFQYGGVEVHLVPHTGVLLPPGEPHAYLSTTSYWQTLYITFGGPAAATVLSSLGLNRALWYHWDAGSSLESFGMDVVNTVAPERDMSGLDASADLYKFLTLLKKHGRTGSLPSLSEHVERISPVLDFMQKHYNRPEIGLEDMAAVLHVSVRHLNNLFKQSLGVTAYAYLIVLRLRKAKELMTSEPSLSVKETARMVGFRDASHFVATFRKMEGLTPQQFRTLY